MSENNNTEEKKTNRRQSLIIDDTKYYTYYNDKFKNKEKWEAPNDKKMKSFIPGTILKIHVKEGKKVRKGKLLLILEAMKMRNRILAPFSGKIKKINIEEGQTIPKNHLMIEFE